MAAGTKDDPWVLTTPPGSSEYTMYRDEDSDPPTIVCQVGSTKLLYDARAIDELHADDSVDRIDVVSSTGTVDLDFTNQAMPTGGIIAKTEEGSIDMRVPNLKLTSEELDEDFFYRINATSNQGSVDLAKDLEKYDASKDPKDAEGKAIIPVSVTADTGAITIDQN